MKLKEHMSFLRIAHSKWAKSSNELNLFMLVILIISWYLTLTIKNKYMPLFVFILSFIYICNNLKIILFSLLLMSFIYFSVWYSQPKILDEYINGEFKIIETSPIGPIIKYKKQKILVNIFGKTFFKGETILIKGKIGIPNKNNNFDIEQFLKSYNIVNIIKYPKIEIISINKGLQRYIHEYFYFSEGNFGKVCPLLLLGKKTRLSKNIYDIALELNIGHLFIVSGFHISLLYKGFNKFLKFLNQNIKRSELYSLIIPIFYAILLSGSISSIRVLLISIFSYYFKYHSKKKISKINILSLTCLLLFFQRPWIIFRYSFIYSFLACFMIEIIRIKKIKNKTKEFFLIIIGVFLINLPISIFLNKFLSLYSIIFSIGYTPIFVLYYILTIFLFPFPFILEKLYGPFLYLLNYSSIINYKIHFFIIDIRIIQIFYFLLISSFIIKKIWNLYMEKKYILLKKKLKK